MRWTTSSSSQTGVVRGVVFNRSSRSETRRSRAGRRHQPKQGQGQRRVGGPCVPVAVPCVCSPFPSPLFLKERGRGSTGGVFLFLFFFLASSPRYRRLRFWLGRRGFVDVIMINSASLWCVRLFSFRGWRCTHAHTPFFNFSPTLLLLFSVLCLTPHSPRSPFADFSFFFFSSTYLFFFSYFLTTPSDSCR